jgi:hypothetical protein
MRGGVVILSAAKDLMPSINGTPVAPAMRSFASLTTTEPRLLPNTRHTRLLLLFQ